MWRWGGVLFSGPPPRQCLLIKFLKIIIIKHMPYLLDANFKTAREMEAEGFKSECVTFASAALFFIIFSRIWHALFFTEVFEVTALMFVL